MTCKVGDKVRFLNDVGGGKVTRIDKNTVYVLGADGFEVPVLKSEVIVVSQATDMDISQNKGGFSEQNSDDTPLRQSLLSQEQAEATEEHDPSEVDFLETDLEKDPEGDMVALLIGVLPVDQDNTIGSDQKAYIINDSPYRVFFSISKWQEGSVKPLKAGFLYPDTKEFVAELNRSELNEELILNIQAIFFKNSEYVPQQPEFYDLKLNPKKFLKPGAFTSNEYFEERALVFTLVDSQKEILVKSLTDSVIKGSIKTKDQRPQREIKKEEPEIEEVDLHIHELVDNPKDYTPGQIIEIQLARFKVALEGGIKSKSSKMVFIHGVGNGKLKHEVRKELEKNYPKFRYQDASFREYGYGGTMVFLRR